MRRAEYKKEMSTPLQVVTTFVDILLFTCISFKIKLST